MTTEGVLVIEAKRHRTQEQNRQDARARLIALLQKALEKPKPRHRTRPTLASQKRRVEKKKHRAAIKRLRQAYPPDE
jgi:ribosome-associated protein